MDLQFIYGNVKSQIYDSFLELLSKSIKTN